MTETNGLFQPKPCNDLAGFILESDNLLDRKKDDWVFRGQERKACIKNGKWEWLLSTSFERACDRFGVEGEERPKLEEKMIREFQRRLHQYTADVPDMESTDEWLALMQHHGAPTRLLDFTYSPYVAAYFAFECAEPNGKVAVWAVDATWFEDQLDGRLKKLHRRYQEKRLGKDFNAIFMEGPPNKLVLGINPFRLNERLAYQKGAFLCPGDVTVGFMDNLSSCQGKKDLKDRVIQYTIPTGEDGKNRNDVLSKLELMNISRATLFPDLDGFAKSLSVKMVTLFQKQLERDRESEKRMTKG